MELDNILAELSKATTEDLTAALAAIREGAGKVDTSAGYTEETVKALEDYAAAKAQIEGEINRRAELASRGDAAKGAFAEGEGDAGDGEDKPDEGDKNEDGDAGTEGTEGAGSEGGEGDGAEGGDAGDGGEEGGDAGLTASAALGSIGKQQKGKAVTKFAGVVTGTTRYIGGQSGHVTPGAQLDWEGLADAFSEQAQALSAAGVQGKFPVARVETAYPEDRVLSGDDSYRVNRAKLDAVKAPEALTAAGGLCAPLENRYDINVLGITDRPVRDALTRFTVARGGIQYRPPMDALTMTDGLGIWTADMDAQVGVGDPADDPKKTCAVVECPALEDAIVEAIYLCLQFPNFTARFDREFIDAATRAALVAHARFAENNLLSKLLTGSKLLTHETLVGTAGHMSGTRDILVAIDKSVAYYRNRHRLDTMVPLRMILPRWVLDFIRADLCRGLGSAYSDDQLGIADAAIMAFFRNRGVNVTFHLDGLAAQTVGGVSVPQQFYANAAAGSAVPNFIDKIDALLFAEGDWLFLDGGTLDLGIVRDSQLNAINRYQTFVEDWEGVAFDGIESLRLVLTVQPTGMVGGTVDLSALTD